MMGMLPPPPPAPFALWPGQERAVLAFCTVATQWRGDGGGLDYAGVRAGLDMAGITLTPREFDDLRAIEAGAVKGFGERT